MLTSVTGCTATLTSQITATVVNSGFSTQSLCSKHVEFFDNSSALNDSVVGWLWQFGDGGTSTDQNPVHAFPHEGSWPVTLIAYTSQGCSDTLIQNVEVIPSPNAIVSLQNGCTGMQATLASASTVAAGSIIAWNWELGNGLTSAGPSISYAYPQSGFYNVKLSLISAPTIRWVVILSKYNSPTCPPRQAIRR